MNLTEYCGYVTIIGRPNVGKSTLLNSLIGHKISITSAKPQTTRTSILGIKTIDERQAVYVDTPGMHKTEKRTMNRYMNRLAQAMMLDADVIVFVVEALRFKEEDKLILQKLKEVKAPVILVINKIDLVKDKSQLLPFIDQLQTEYTFKNVVPLSAKKVNDILHLEKIIFQLLPANPLFFDKDQLTDKSDRFQAAELIREKLIKQTKEELPYSTAVMIDSLEEKNNILHINAIIWVEREGQKPIVIGKDGERLKKIGTLARMDLQKLFNKKVFLRLWVKVKNNWSDNEKLLQNLGYNS